MVTKTKDTKKPAAEQAFPEPTDADKVEARKQGVKDAIQESVKEAYKTGADEGYGDNLVEDGNAQRFQGSKEVAHLQFLVDLPIDELEANLNPTGDTDLLHRSGSGVRVALTDAQIAGLLEVERSGKNRTDVVQALCKRLGIKHPHEVTSAGPAYTNDITRL